MTNKWFVICRYINFSISQKNSHDLMFISMEFSLKLSSLFSVDTENPVVSCIADITRTVPIVSSGTAVFWTEPTATDNSGVVSLQQRSHAPGDFFAPGTTQVTYIFIDPSGLRGNCVFTVTINRGNSILVYSLLLLTLVYILNCRQTHHSLLSHYPYMGANI